MEKINIYDDSMKPIGIVPKKDAHTIGAWHKSIHCWILRRDINDSYVVFQKRGPHKKSFPNYLDISAAGHYQAGEHIEDGVREIVEELGIKVKYEDLLYLGIKFDVYKDSTIFNREFCETFLLQENRPLDQYPIDCDEVTGLVQISVNDGLDLFSNKVDHINATGVEYSEASGKISKINISVTKDSFIHRIDPYYGKIFMIAKAFFAGERQLFI